MFHLSNTSVTKIGSVHCPRILLFS
uniref:Uncharacterized protein n=1 Tax=Arundo donax TaxID=35708 RepID=A0A0A9ALU4_ARUDO